MGFICEILVKFISPFILGLSLPPSPIIIIIIIIALIQFAFGKIFIEHYSLKVKRVDKKMHIFTELITLSFQEQLVFVVSVRIKTS